MDFAALQGSTLSDDRMTTGFGPFELLTKCLWTWVWAWAWPWPRPRPCTKATRQETGKASRGEPLLDQHDSVPQFAGCLSIVYYVVSQVNVNNHPECLMQR